MRFIHLPPEVERRVERDLQQQRELAQRVGNEDGAREVRRRGGVHVAGGEEREEGEDSQSALRRRRRGKGRELTCHLPARRRAPTPAVHAHAYMHPHLHRHRDRRVREVRRKVLVVRVPAKEGTGLG